MRVLLAGCGGYLGIPLAEALAARGHHVTGFDRLFFGKRPKEGPNLAVIRGDIRSVSLGVLRTTDTSKPTDPPAFDAVVDLAGLSNDLTAEIDPDLTRSINIEGGRRLATLAKQAGVRRYVYSSSASVYGAGDRPNLTETDACKPLTLYARSKVEVEDHLRSIAGDGFEPVILRNATVFGVAPRMRFDLAVNVMTLRAWRDNVIFVMGGGEQWRPFIHVDDVVRAFVWAVEADNVAGETFNVGTSNRTIAEVAKKVADEFPMARVMPIPDDPDKRSYSCSFDKMNRAMPWGSKDEIVRGSSGVNPGLIIRHPGLTTVEHAIDRMSKMLRDGTLKDDETCYTLNYYRSLIAWEKKLNEIRLDGRIL
jgi:nucleoside-diphosphate-sugar epimerase